MQIGWTGYTSLRRDLIAPINNIDQYVSALPDFETLNDSKVHWMPLKRLRYENGAASPTAEADEVRAHNAVVHYRDCFHTIAEHVGLSPMTGRWNWIRDHPFDATTLKYQVPYLDVLIVESTGHPGSAYVATLTIKAIYERNPNVGIVVIDQDLTGSVTFSKLRKWHPNIMDRTILATYHPKITHPHQAFLPPVHLAYREQPYVTGKKEVCYVGNDYLRREPMTRLMQGPQFHLYGRLKKDFAPAMLGLGVHCYGGFIPTCHNTVEDRYRQHGVGLHMARENYYPLNLLTPRLSEITRAGCLILSDHKLKLAAPLVGHHFMVLDAEDVVMKADAMARDPDMAEQCIAGQRANIRHYLNSDRYSETLFRCCQRLHAGPMGDQPWHISLYDDLLVAGGLRPWGIQYDSA